MKNIKKIISLILAAVLMTAFTACGQQSAPQQPQQDNPEAVQQENKTEEQSAENSTSSQTTDDVQQSEEKTEKSENTFDAETALTIEAVDKGVKYTFSTMPQTAEDIRALADRYSLSDPRTTAALFMASLVKYTEDADEGLDMMDVVKGPQPLSDAEKAFIKERLIDKKYLPGAYFEGAKPENNYQPDEPWCIVVADEAVSAPEGYSYVTVSTEGADSPRRICMRIKGDSHYIWEYNGVLLSIRLPAEEDPWL